MKNTDIEYYGDKLQNQFTAYVERALYNNRISYYRKYISQYKHEILTNSEDELSLHNYRNSNYSDSCYLGLDSNSIHNSSLAAVLNKLNIKDQTIIKLHAIYGYTYKAIAQVLSMTPTAVSTRYSRSIKKVRKILEDNKNVL